MAQLQILAYGITSKIEIAILHTDIVPAIALVLNCEGRCETLVQHIKLGYVNLYLTCWQIYILAIAFCHHTGGLHNVLTTQLLSLLLQPSRTVLIKGQLSNTIAVAQIDKSQRSQVVNTLHPTSQGNSLTYISQTQLTTRIRSVHIIFCLNCYDNWSHIETIVNAKVQKNRIPRVGNPFYLFVFAHFSSKEPQLSRKS